MKVDMKFCLHQTNDAVRLRAVISISIFMIYKSLGAPSSTEAPPSSAAPNCVTQFFMNPENFTQVVLQRPTDIHARTPTSSPELGILLTEDPSLTKPDATIYNVGRARNSASFSFNCNIRRSNGAFPSFNTVFTFQIRTITPYNMSGDGIAFAITTDADPPLNSSGRFLGLMQEHPEERTQRIVFLEFDSFQNGEVGFNDPSASHIGINKGNMSSVMLRDTSDPSDPLYLYANYTITAWLSYNSSENVIRVWATNNSASSERPANPILVLQKINLTQYFENHNHTDVYAVITAASGNNSQNTILRNWNLTIEIQSERTRDLDLRRLYLLLLLLPVLFVALAAYRMRGAKQRKLIGKRIAVLEVASKPVHRYKYFELKRATQSFRSDFIIGRGGFSIVYKGLLPDGNLVAIKRMRDGFADADLIAKEVQIISKIEHRNLLRLEGWCFEAGETLLVFKYMPNGSLDSYLHGEKRKSGYVLRSKTRIQIIRDVAAALEYLHHCLEECVLHRDVKAANVLLTEDMEAKLGDFGLARLGPHNEIFTTLPMGTPGYVAPEVHTGQVTEKTDVYSFGVLVIEIACGERPLDPYSSTYSRLVDRVWLYHSKGSIMGVLDPSLMQEMTTQSDAATDTKGVDEELKKWKCVLHLGLTCCQASPSARPDMRKVLKALEDFEIMEAPRSWTLYPGENFSSAGRMSSDASSSTISQYFSVLSYKEDRS